MRVPGILLTAAVACIMLGAADVAPKTVLTGEAAFAGYPAITPGVFRKITPESLPEPYATKSASNAPQIVPRPADAWPRAPRGFKVELFTTGLNYPRSIRRAPNGDLFFADTRNHASSGVVKVLRGTQVSTFLDAGLRSPFGIAFYPPGPDPHWVYIANTDSLIRLPYKNGDLAASGPAETIIPELPRGGHETRDVAFSADGARMFVAVGSGSNVDDPDTHPREIRRANILEYTPAGKFVKIYASGIRNPVGIAINPLTGELWCSVNERDELGDNLVPDYITHVREGGFYGWPWYYTGGHQDPRHQGAHPELKDRVIVPDVLLNAHNASLEMVFYDGKQFPSEYRGDIFAAEHGSWNKSVRAGYEVVRVPLDKGHAAGEYEDFITGFVTAKGEVWGRPVGVAVASDGSLMVTDDASKSIWRVTYVGDSGQ